MHFLQLTIIVFQIFLTLSQSVSNKEYLLLPNLFHFDNFDQCLLHGKNAIFCMIQLQLAPINVKNKSETWNIVQRVSSDWRNYRHDIIRHGICIPETCPDVTTSQYDPGFGPKVEKCLSAKYLHLGMKGKINKLSCQGPDSKYTIGPLHYLFLLLVGVLGALVLFATLYEGWALYKPGPDYDEIVSTKTGQIICAFSVTRNWHRLKTVNFDDPEVRLFRPIQGIRFYNMILVILMHTVMQNLASPVSNPIYVENITTKFLNIFLANGGYAVQTSFSLSSLFLTYNFLEMYKDKSKIDIYTLCQAFFHRYVRLTPTLALLVLFQATWLPLVGRGPFWDDIIGEEHRRCRENGWSNILFINNYISPEKMCLPHTWYMAVDTQFFFLALPCIYFIKKNLKYLVSIVSAIILFHITLLFCIIYANNWESTIRPTPEVLYKYNIISHGKWHMLLGSNYSNMAGLAAGLSLGYIFHKYKNVEIFNTKRKIFLWWITVWGLGLGIILFPGLIIYSQDYEHHRLFAAIYGGVSRTVFITGISVGIVGLCQKVGWLMKRTCEWYPTYVLGRLTYNAYLVHLPLLMIRSSIKRAPTYLNDYLMFTEMVSDVVFAYIGAVVLALMIELPVSQLQKVTRNWNKVTNFKKNK